MNFIGILKALVWIGAAYLYAYAVGGKIPYFIFYTSVGIVITAFFWSKFSARVNAFSYTEIMHAQVGSRVKVFIEIQNNSGWPIPWVQCWLEMPDSFCLPDNLACYTVSLSPHEKRVISEEFECRTRGRYYWGSILVRTGDILGVFVNSRTRGEAKELVVLPEVYDLGEDFGAVTGRRFGDTPASLHHSRGGTSFMGVRKYTTSDGISRIHWKASARMQTLFIKEFQEQKTFEFTLFLDLHEDHHAGSGSNGSIEKAVSLTASMVALGSRVGHGLGLIVYGSEHPSIPVSYGKGHFNVLLETLVEAQAGKDFIFDETFTHEITFLPKNCYAFVITGSLSELLADSLIGLKTRGHGSTVFLFKPESFGGTDPRAGDRERYILRLKGSGITVITVQQETDFRLLFRGLNYGAG